MNTAATATAPRPLARAALTPSQPALACRAVSTPAAGWAEQTRVSTPAPASFVVTTQGLTKTYGTTTVVDDVSLAVPGGGIYGFLGPNGAGKSTTMKLLLGLTSPTSGQMTIMGRPVSTRSPMAPGTIGSLIEGPSYYPSLTGRENLAMLAAYLQLPASRVDHALDLVDLASHGSKQARQYSLGMKQRLGLAMALLASPPLLLLDEPTNGLDPAGVAEVRELIVSLARQEGVTVIVSSHILSEIEQMADVVGIICAGRLRYQGPLSGLQDAGVIDITASDPAGLSALLTENQVQHQRYGDAVRLPMLPDPVVGDLVSAIVRSGQTIYRVQTVRKTLEQAFLELTDPAAAPARAAEVTR
ncbi:MAG: ATP-binding cassette domain-containing protein [Actinomycetia bacterium]|nr:ATP-binding cassette domain-containing protein [Actinomycetes bacterium]